MISETLGMIIGIVDNAIERFFPKKIDEETKQKFKNEMTKYFLNNSFKENESFRNFILQYEGKAKDLPKFIQIIRALVRPILTVIITGAYIWAWLQPEKFTPEQMAVLKPALLIVLIFWFGDRAIQKSGILQIFTKNRENTSRGGK